MCLIAFKAVDSMFASVRSTCVYTDFISLYLHYFIGELLYVLHYISSLIAQIPYVRETRGNQNSLTMSVSESQQFMHFVHSYVGKLVLIEFLNFRYPQTFRHSIPVFVPLLKRCLIMCLHSIIVGFLHFVRIKHFDVLLYMSTCYLGEVWTKRQERFVKLQKSHHVIPFLFGILKLTMSKYVNAFMVHQV